MTKERSYSGLKADLAAANQEVRTYMDQVSFLKKVEGEVAAEMERKYAAKLANMAVLVRHLADQIAELAGRIAQR